MARGSVRIGSVTYLGGIPGQERRNRRDGTLHLGPKGLYVSRVVVLGVTVLPVKYGKVDREKVSSIAIGSGTTQGQVAITVHLKDGSAGSYEVNKQAQENVLGLLQPVATQLGVPITEQVLPEEQTGAPGM